MNRHLLQMMNEAEEKVQVLLTLGGHLDGFFMCHGPHGDARFEFETPRDEQSKQLLEDRMYFNILGLNATEAMIVHMRRVTSDLEKFPPAERAALEELRGQEVLVINGESGTERLTKTLPVLRTAEGQFAGFGLPREMPLAKESGDDARYVAGMMLTEDERIAALDQAGNLQYYAEMQKRKAKEASRGRMQ